VKLLDDERHAGVELWIAFWIVLLICAAAVVFD